MSTQPLSESTNQPKKRNFDISYIKGFAILAIMLIHLLDWGDVAISPTGRLLKQILFIGVVFFMVTSGSVVWIAYGKSSDMVRSTKRLLRRGLELIAVYYIYNIVKFAVFDFTKENFYGGYISRDIFNWSGILTLKSFAVPIPILVTIGIFICISPLFLFLLQRVKWGVLYVYALLAVVLFANYVLPLPQNFLTNFLYARGNILFAPLPWFTAFLLGLLLAYHGFDKKKKLFLRIFSLSIPFTFWYAQSKGFSFFLDESLHPLQPHALGISFVFMFLLLYFFEAVEKYKQKKFVLFFLATFRLLGDFTLWLYIAHWIMIDVVLWIFAPKSYLVWVGMFFLLCTFFYSKRKMLQKYVQEYL